jgi:hypothetical protein
MGNKDLQDIHFIAEEFVRFAKMDFKEYRKHIEMHPEDKMHWLDMPGGGHRIGSAASSRFWQIAERRLGREPDASAIDVATLQRLVRAQFVKHFIVDRKPIEQKFVDRMMNKAVKAARAKHCAITHYIPCVIMTDPDPPQFSIGPVQFRTRSAFYQEYRAKIEDDYRTLDNDRKEKLARLIAEGKYRAEDQLSPEAEARLDTSTLDWIFGYYDAFVWVAEVPVPACEPKVSRQRADQAAQAALDVLKLFFGHHGGVDFRLAHDRGKPHKTAHVTRRDDGLFRWEIGRQGEGAFVKQGWYERMQRESGWALEAAGSAIEAYLNPAIESEHRDRWLGALTWYGQATRDQLPAGQLVKYVAALERLTVTDYTPVDGVTDTVTRRTALLAVTEYKLDVLADARSDARKIYRWRSNLMHGRSSPVTKELASVMHLAYRTAQQALFVALHMLVHLEVTGRTSGRDLEDEFTDLERELPREEQKRNPHVAQLEKLSLRLRAAASRMKRGKERSLAMRAAAVSREITASFK